MARPTVQGYFEVLTDTLIGAWLPAWRPRAKVKETGHPRFYLFDCGVVRALAGRSREPLVSAERGPLLETLVFHELRAQLAYAGLGGSLAYYRTPSRSKPRELWTGSLALHGRMPGGPRSGSVHRLRRPAACLRSARGGYRDPWPRGRWPPCRWIS